ncbi:MAG: hypothetical protein ISR65_02890 [Bacteriovoracaceae bacterium]|nr:hypothetical protein [Bacteriovoracaceae bacterium]
MSFPITMIEDHKISLITGDSGHLYEVFPPDLEQIDIDSLTSFYSDLGGWVNTLPENNFVRIFHLNQRIIVYTDQLEFSIPDCKVVPLNDFKELFYDLDDLYSNPTFEGDKAILNGRYYRLINLYNMPPNPAKCELLKFENFALNFKRLSGEKAKKVLHFKRKLHYSNLQKNIRDIESESSYQESESLLEKIIHGRDSLLDVEGWIIVKANSYELLNQKTDQILYEMKQKDYEGLIETVGLSTYFKNIFFFEFPSFGRSHPANGTYLTNLLPMSCDVIDEDGVEFKSRSGTKIHIQLDNKVANNNNVVCIGATGVGKSFLMNKVVYEELKKGAKAIILDYDSSFLRNTLYNNGNVFDSKFNPMQFRDPVYLKNLILSMTDKDDFDIKGQGKLFAAIKDILDRDENITFKELVLKLNDVSLDIRYYFEEYWEYFTDELLPLADITFVDCNKYPDKILPGLIIYLIEVFKSLEGRRIFVLEESWNILEKAEDFIVKFFRTFRKKGATAIAISQSLEDLIKTPVGRVIAQNSFHKIIFKQDLRESEFVDKFDIAQVKSLMGVKGIYSEFYYKSDFNRKCVRYFGTPLEYEIFNTTKEHSEKINEFISDYKKYFSVKECIEKFTEIKYA